MLSDYKKQKFHGQESVEISSELVKIFEHRRTIRQFSKETAPIKTIINAITLAKNAPSGANRQPWSYCLVENKLLRSQIREMAEQEEFDFYVDRPNKQWVKDLEHLNTDPVKEFITDAGHLLVVFYKHFDMEDGEKKINYYAKESVGISVGMLISALHMSGLSCLTYTPKKMQFLSKLLSRPKEERPFLVLGIGLPKDDAQVPVINRKSIEQVLNTYS